MPWTAGSTPVIMVVCDGYVTVGITPVTPRDQAPRCMSRRIVGTFAWLDSAYTCGRIPSIDTITTWRAGESVLARAASAQRQMQASSPVAASRRTSVMLPRVAQIDDDVVH